MKLSSSIPLFVTVLVLLSAWSYRHAFAQLEFTQGQDVGNYCSRYVSLADADGDGDADAFVSNWNPISDNQPSILWLNDGGGLFAQDAQLFPASQNTSTLTDLDGDGDVDLWLAGVQYAQDYAGQAWRNDGNGHFSVASTGHMSGETALGDLDGDGDTDAFVVNYNLGIQIYFNNGAGQFAYTGQAYTQARAAMVSLADLDGDGDLDAFVTSYGDEQYPDGRPDRVWLNNGSGRFTDSGQRIGQSQGYDVALGDVDGDSDVDALVGNAHRYPYYWLEAQPNKLWINNGSGVFHDSGQDMDISPMSGVALGDVDNDGDLDALIFNAVGDVGSPNKIMINNGAGQFADSGVRLGHSESLDGAVGDLDEDGSVDIFVTNYGPPDGQPNIVWLNSSAVPIFLSQFTVSVTDEDVRITWLTSEEATSGDFRVTASRGDDRWDVAVTASSLKQFEAVDRSSKLKAGGAIDYDLYVRDDNEDWSFLRCERVVLNTSTDSTGLLGAYPNPFNPHTTISFTVHRSQFVTVEIVDSIGRKVNTLADGSYDPGDYRVSWNGLDMIGNEVSSGVYFLTFRAGKTFQSRKLVLVR